MCLLHVFIDIFGTLQYHYSKYNAAIANCDFIVLFQWLSVFLAHVLLIIICHYIVMIVFLSLRFFNLSYLLFSQLVGLSLSMFIMTVFGVYHYNYMYDFKMCIVLSCPSASGFKQSRFVLISVFLKCSYLFCHVFRL